MFRKSSRKAERVVNRVLADGTTKTYRYPPYRGGHKAKVRGDTLGDLIEAWERSPEWLELATTTQNNHQIYLKPLMGMERVEVSKIERRVITDIRNAIAQTRGNGASTGFVKTASALFGWAIENGWLKASPTVRMRRLKGGHLPAWTPEEAVLAIENLPEHLRRAVVLALYSGQRRGDLVRLPWSAYDGRTLRLRQGKTGTSLVIPVHPALKIELDAWKADTTSTIILVNKFGRPWQPINLSSTLSDWLARIDGFPPKRNIHGLRKLAAINLAQCGCTLHEIGAITGHKSLAMIQLYCIGVDQERLAESAVLRMVTNAQTARKPAD